MKPTLKLLQKKADSSWSLYIRKRDANFAGTVRCVTCGHREHWKEFDCGHYLSRRFLSVRYDERNTAPQCRNCNRVRQGEEMRMLMYLERKYGKEAIEQMEMLGHKVIMDKRGFLLDQIDRINLLLNAKTKQ